MKQKHAAIPAKISCTKCGLNAVGTQAHVGRKHKSCGNSPAGESRNSHGTWQSGHQEVSR